MGIEENDTVNIKYVLTYDGRIQEQNDDFTTLVSNSALIEGFYLGLLFMKVGEFKDLTVPPEKGYPDGHFLGEKTLYFEITINSIVQNVRGEDYTEPSTDDISVFDFYEEDAGTEQVSLFENLITSPVFLLISLSALVLFAYVKATGTTTTTTVQPRAKSTKLTAKEKVAQRMREVEQNLQDESD